MKKKANLLIIVAFILVLVGAIILLGNKKTKVQQPKNSFQIATSFYPLYFFTKNIVGDYATVTNITPSGSEPHDYELSTQDLRTIQESKLIVVNGAGLESWLSKITSDTMTNHTTILVTSESIAVSDSNGTDHAVDPHIWLDPVLAIEQVHSITQAVSRADPVHQDIYKTNATHLIEQLTQLSDEFKSGLSQCSLHEVITSHAAFGYMAKEYSFTQVAISGLSPDEEPTPQKLATIATLAKQKGIKHIFFETLISSRLADTLAKETGATTLVFNPLEGLTPKEESEGQTYFSIQRENLKNLKIALECK